jgi:hypothetical protein
MAELTFPTLALWIFPERALSIRLANEVTGLSQN